MFVVHILFTCVVYLIADQHYLDHAGATLYSDTQMKKVSENMLTTLYANPHSAGAAGNLTHDIIERTRYRWEISLEIEDTI